MADVNIVILIGRLTADPELRHTSNDVPFTTFTIAVNRRSRSENKHADFVNVIAWRQHAEFVTKYFKKGSAIYVRGAIQTSNFVDKETQKNRVAFNVVATEVQFAGSKRNDSESDYEEEALGSVPYPSSDADLIEFTDMSAIGDDLPF